MRRSRGRGCWHAHRCAAHSRGTGWLPAGWEYKILTLASPDIDSPCLCIQTSTQLCQLPRIGDRWSILRLRGAGEQCPPPTAVLNGRCENHSPNPVGSFFLHTCVTPADAVIPRSVTKVTRGPWVKRLQDQTWGRATKWNPTLGTPRFLKHVDLADHEISRRIRGCKPHEARNM